MGDSQNSYLSTNPSTIIIVHICFIVKGKQLILFIFSQLCSLLLYIITITHLHPKGTVHILSHHCTAISQNCNTGLSKHSNISPTFYVHLFVFHATIRPFPNFPTSPLLLFSLQHAPICTRTYLRQSFFQHTSILTLTVIITQLDENVKSITANLVKSPKTGYSNCTSCTMHLSEYFFIANYTRAYQKKTQK